MVESFLPQYLASTPTPPSHIVAQLPKVSIITKTFSKIGKSFHYTGNFRLRCIFNSRFGAFFYGNYYFCGSKQLMNES